ncbi:MAG: right-handed parallel beta-helix repeat-containing protein [Archaeoglobaceae archaeon]
MRIGALLALLFLSLAPVLAVDVDKCTEITQPGYYRLVNDISGILSGKNYCIGIFANDVVLDGQEFSISGRGSGYGIYISASNVTIKNVIFFRYFCGIYISSSSNNTIENNTISNGRYGNINSCGIYLQSSTNNVIKSNTISENGDGIELSSSSNNVIENNTISNNNYYGIVLHYSSNNNTIKNNSFTNCGLYVFDSYNNRVENNLVNGKTARIP